MATLDASDLVSFSISNDIVSNQTATIVLDNSKKIFNPQQTDFLGEVITIQMNDGVNPNVPLFRGYVKVVTPIYSGVDHSTNPDPVSTTVAAGGGMVSMQLVSVQEQLANRPITTETQTDSGTTIMDYLLSTFGGLTVTTDYDVTFDNSETFDKINVSENSILEAVKKIAEACNCEIFIDYSGVIKTEAKKNNASSVDFTLDKEDIIGPVQQQYTDVLVPSVARIRGRLVSALEAGYGVVLNNVTYQAEASKDGSVDIDMQIPNVDDTQAFSMQFSSLSGASGAQVISADESGNVKVRFSGGSHSAGDTVQIGFTADSLSSIKKEIEAGRFDSLSSGTGRSMDKVQAAKNAGVLVYHRGNVDNQIPRHADEGTISRIESVVSDTISHGLVGTRFTELDNLYIQDVVAAALIGDRLLLERRMARSRYSFSMMADNPVLLPLNSVVNLPLADTGTTKKVLIVQSTFNFDAANMGVIASYTAVEILSA